METDNAMIGGLIFIALVAGANFVMYAVVRGSARSGGKKSFMETFSDSFKTSPKSKDTSMDELRKRIEELDSGKKDGGKDSEQ